MEKVGEHFVGMGAYRPKMLTASAIRRCSGSRCSINSKQRAVAHTGHDWIDRVARLPAKRRNRPRTAGRHDRQCIAQARSRENEPIRYESINETTKS